MALGFLAMNSNNLGSRNIAIGRDALLINVNGSNNTAIGFEADVLSGNLTNATAIGFNAKVGASNSLVLGGTGANAVKVGIGITNPTRALLETGGNASSVPSAIFGSDAWGVSISDDYPSLGFNSWWDGGNSKSISGTTGYGAAFGFDPFSAGSFSFSSTAGTTTGANVNQTMLQRLTINKFGSLGLGSAVDYGTAGKVLTSQGDSAEPTWSSPSFTAPLLVPSFTNVFQYSGNSNVHLKVNNGTGRYEFGELFNATGSVFSIDWDLGNTYIKGNVGIGTATPTSKLEVAGNIQASNLGLGITPSSLFQARGANGEIRFHPYFGAGATTLLGSIEGFSSGPQLRLYGAPAGNFIDIGQDGSGNFTVEDNDTPVLTVTTGTQNVGIGTTTPAAKLEVQNDALTVHTSPFMRLRNDNGSGQIPIEFQIGGVLRGKVRADYSGNMTYVSDGGDHAFYTGGDFGTGTERLKILNNGNVGIGTTAPTRKLEINEPNGLGANQGALTIYTNNSGPSGSVKAVGNETGNSSGTVNYATGSLAAYLQTPIGFADIGVLGHSNSSHGGFFSRGTDDPLTATSYAYLAGPSYAGYFQGNVHVNGTLSKASGSFKIDHPLDPDNKYLIHSFVESPDMMNVYNGNIKTGSDGMATVNLPDYFSALNKDFRYQLTVIGEFAQAIVYDEVKGNSFVIKTDKPNVKVSWQVTGIRKDPYAEKNRILPEVLKEGDDRGKYLMPELYNRPNTDRIGHQDGRSRGNKRN